LKYVKNDVSLFYVKNEIIHQTSCSHTSQQNNVAEHKNINISLMLLEPWWYMWMFQSICGLMLFWVLVTWSIECLLLFLFFGEKYCSLVFILVEVFHVVPYVFRCTYFI